MYTKTEIKQTFNALSNKANLKFKYKRCIKNSNSTILFEAYHFEDIIFSSFYGLKFFSYNKSNNKAIWSCTHEDIRIINKYNLKN
jgi:hypothetical protein